jgi:hypothetical protein
MHGVWTKDDGVWTSERGVTPGHSRLRAEAAGGSALALPLGHVCFSFFLLFLAEQYENRAKRLVFL